MYENITYEELKKLPDEQKIEALKELRKKYPTNKELGERLGVRPLVASNMYDRLVEGKKVGGRPRKNMKETEQPAEDIVNRDAAENEVPVTDADALAKDPVKTRQRRTKPASFTIVLENEMEGEEAQARITGIAQSLLKDKRYKIDLNIIEK